MRVHTLTQTHTCNRTQSPTEFVDEIMVSGAGVSKLKQKRPTMEQKRPTEKQKRPEELAADVLDEIMVSGAGALKVNGKYRRSLLLLSRSLLLLSRSSCRCCS